MADKNIVYGIRPVIEAIEAGNQIERIYMKKGIDSPLANRIAELAKDDRIALQYVPIEKLNRLTNNNHQGVVAKISAIEYAEITDIIADIESTGRKPIVVVLDSVTDVRNFGAIARSAECAGADALVVSLKNSAPVNGEAIKSSAGALNTIPVCRVGSIRNTLKTLQLAGMKLVAASEKSETPYWEEDLREGFVLIMGSEDRGISKEVLKMCDSLIAIPLKGKIESLNVSAAASVLLFEAVKQRS